MKLIHVFAASAMALAGGAFAVNQEGAAPARSDVAPPASSPALASVASPAERRALFGELHLHTAMSFDAWTFGTKILPDAAYRFGRGETVMVPAEQVAMEQGIAARGLVPARRAWPLDFMAVTDHAEYMGVMNQVDDPTSDLARSAIGQEIIKTPERVFDIFAKGGLGAPIFNVAAAGKSAWELEVKAANDNYQPGKFTTFIGYEWTSRPDGRTLHRNVIFAGDHAPAPFTSLQSTRPEDLWAYLEAARAQGFDALAIPHNANISGGLMFDWNDSSGRRIDEAYAQRRATAEPLTEIIQTKGQSETSPLTSPNDEFANFQVLDHLVVAARRKSNPLGSYFRQALGRGLVIEQKVGANPYKLGVVGGTDLHNGLSASDENAYAGDISGLDPATMRPRGDAAKVALGIIKKPETFDLDAMAGDPPVDNNPLEYGSAGLTGVWAETNTRESIFAALKRKETFATSGTRIRVRMFSGWTYAPGLIHRPDWVRAAYVGGAPMGGDLPAAPGGGARPTFLLEAAKDPDGANLDRIQIVKVWREGGTYHERVFDVALSGTRRVDPRTGRAPPVGNTVDLKTGRYRNTIGAAILRAQWSDPTFEPGQAAAYYARVLEIPTPCWSTLLAIANRLPIPTTAPATIQERAWSSPIWYTPPRPAKVSGGRALSEG